MIKINYMYLKSENCFRVCKHPWNEGKTSFPFFINDKDFYLKTKQNKAKQKICMNKLSFHKKNQVVKTSYFLNYRIVVTHCVPSMEKTGHDRIKSCLKDHSYFFTIHLFQFMSWKISCKNDILSIFMLQIHGQLGN